MIGIIAIEIIAVLWIPFGLLNFYVMKKADQAANDNPPFGVYWVKHKEARTFLVSLTCGLLCLPFTLWAAYEWKKSRTNFTVAR